MSVRASIHVGTFPGDQYDGCAFLTWSGAYPTALIERLGLELDSYEVLDDDGGAYSPSHSALIVGVELGTATEALVERINAVAGSAPGW